MMSAQGFGPPLERMAPPGKFSGTGTPDDLEDEKDEVLAFHKGTLSLLVVIITSFI